MKQKTLVLALSVLALTACGEKEKAQTVEKAAVPESAPAAVEPVAANTEEKVLNIYNWADYIPADMVANFEKETGVKVNYQTFENNEGLHAKLVAGMKRPPGPVVVSFAWSCCLLLLAGCPGGFAFAVGIKGLIGHGVGDGKKHVGVSGHVVPGGPEGHLAAASGAALDGEESERDVPISAVPLDAVRFHHIDHLEHQP